MHDSKTIRAATGLAVMLALLAVSTDAGAVAAFARKYSMACSGCHMAYPQLNAFGRRFKEAGYRLAESEPTHQEISDALHLDSTFPVSAVLKSRPFDKKTGGDEKIRALHEAELIAGGVLGRKFSAWFEFEAEDEADFSPELDTAVITYHHSDAVNVQLSWAQLFFDDPYGFLGDHFRLTADHIAPFDEAFGGADLGKGLRKNRQNIAVHGRPTERFYYSAGLSGLAGDTEGENARVYHVRGAFDVTPDIMIGALGVFGRDDTANLDFSRAGIDFSADWQGARFQGLWMHTSDDQPAGGSVDNNTLSLQAFYVVEGKQPQPAWVPLVRYDAYEVNDGRDDVRAITLGLSRYFTENIKGSLEYNDIRDAPSGSPETNRFRINIEAVF